MKIETQRQGDLLVEKIESFDPKNMKKSTLVLAEGEVTGHKHQLKGNQIQVYEFENQKYIQVPQTAELIHEEHQKLELDQGFYKVTQQREYSYLNEQIRRVAD